MAEIYTVGETMAVLVPDEAMPLRYISDYRMKIAGAESNTAIGCAKLGHSAAFATGLGADEIGKFLLLKLRAEGVDCSGIYEDPEHRTGMMIKEFGSSETKVYYYRENSAASHLSIDKLDLEAVSSARILHLTGITPVLSQTCRELIDELFAFAQKNNICLSFDPNIRRRLWGDTDYRSLIRSYVLRSQIVLMGRDEAAFLFGTEDQAEIFRILHKDGQVLLAVLKDGARGAVVSDGQNVTEIEPYPCKPIDPVGAGDGFNAGFLCGVLEGKSPVECGRMGAICGAMATETKGDYEGYPEREVLERRLKDQAEIYR